MVPQIYEQDDYVSIYPNSLYTNVKNAIRYQTNFFYDAENYYDPVFLQGYGTCKIGTYNSPNNTFRIKVTSDSALVQFPQFYYKGYYAYAGGTKVGEAQNIDGLIAFKFLQGEYVIKIKFEGCPAYQITRPLFYVGVFSVVAGGVFGLIYRKKIAKKPEEEENN